MGGCFDCISLSFDGSFAFCVLLLGRDIEKEKQICKELENWKEKLHRKKEKRKRKNVGSEKKSNLHCNVNGCK